MLSRSAFRLTRTAPPRPHALFSTLTTPLRQQLQQQQQRPTEPTYQPPSPPQEPDNPHRAFYKSFGRPIAKVFLMALFTYQLLHWSWLRLETTEEKEAKQGELEGLERELREVAAGIKPKA